MLCGWKFVSVLVFGSVIALIVAAIEWSATAVSLNTDPKDTVHRHLYTLLLYPPALVGLCWTKSDQGVGVNWIGCDLPRFENTLAFVSNCETIERSDSQCQQTLELVLPCVVGNLDTAASVFKIRSQI